MANSKSWKSEERIFAAALGLKRNANNGQRQRDIGSDADDISIEHKKRVDMPQWWSRAWSQAVAGADSDQVPVVGISHARGSAYTTERFVVIKLDDFAKMRERAR